METDKEFSEGIVSWGLFAIAIALIGMATTGCSFRVETLYHGRTPIGLDNRQATSLQSTPQPAARVIKYKEE